MRCATRITFALLLTLASFAAFAGELTWTTAGPETGRVTVVRFDPLASNVVWAGTIAHGVYRSADGGVTWVEKNNGLTRAQVSAIAIDPNNTANMWVAGSLGVYRSTDGGNTWVSLSCALAVGGARITGLVLDPLNPSRLYVATTTDIFNQSPGVQRTTDRGETWTDAGVAGLNTKAIFALELERPNPSMLYAGGISDPLERPLFKSADGGTTWYAISSGLSGASVDAIGTDPLVSGTVFVAQDNTLRKSTDGGATWGAGGSGLPTSCCKQIVYERGSSTNIWLATLDDVYRTVNGGVSWTPAKIGSERVNALDINAEGTLVAGTENDGFFRRPGGAESWSASNSGFRAADASIVLADPVNAGVVYAGTQATGLFKSIDHGQSWQRLSPDFLGTTVDAIAIDPSNPAIVYAGTAYGSSFYKSTDAGMTWTAPFVVGRTVHGLAIDPSSTNTIYAATDRGVSKSTDGGATFVSTSKGLPSSWSVSAIVIDPVHPSVLYAAPIDKGIFKSTDGGATWTKKSVGFTHSDVTALVIDRTNPAILYASTFGGGIFKTTNGGDSWSEANAGLPVKTGGPLWIDPADSNIVYTGTSLNGLFRSTDGAATWSQLGGIVFAQGIWSITTEPGGRVVHAGASGGVYSYEFPGGAPRVLPRRRTGR